MRIYVDELPKSCSWCPCFNSSNDTCKIDGSDVDCIPVDSYSVRFFNYTDKRHPICPLQSLANHDKQVRKEVCEEIREEVKKLIDKDFKLCNHEYANGYCYGLQYDLAKILDQIQGETK